MANVTTTWLGLSELPFGVHGGIVNGSAADTAALVFGFFFLHVRGLPMFSFLLGYGVAMLCASVSRRGYTAAEGRAVIARRYLMLALIGAVHMLFLYFADIMFFYGVAGIILAWLSRFSDRVLLWIACSGYAAMVVLMGLKAWYEWPVEPSPRSSDIGVLATSYPAFIAPHFELFAKNMLMLPLEMLLLVPVVLFGFVAGRRRILEQACQHRRVLWSLVAVGVAADCVTAIPQTLAVTGAIRPAWYMVFGSVNQAVGLATGPGILAAIALASIPVQRGIDERTDSGQGPRVPGWLVPFTALGRRSMTGYVLQSVFCVVLLSGIGMNLGHGDGAAAATAWGLFVWVLTLAVAWAMELANLTGPLEWLHRWLSYGRGGLSPAAGAHVH